MFMKKTILLFFILLTSFFKLAAQDAIIYGTVQDSSGKPVPDVNIQILGTKISGLSENDGSFSFKVKTGITYEMVFSFVGTASKRVKVPELNANQKYKLDVFLDFGVELDPFIFYEEIGRGKASSYTIDPRRASSLPNVSGSFEKILTTLPGVSSNNELSAQYNVRGGNFDENLVYVNDIEIYRPFLPRSGQQEGLSFIHSELVQNVKFSAGGFEARYGDKLSSVLDIKYKDPKKFASSVNAGLLGVMAHAEGASKNYRFTYLLGTRYWSNAYVLGTLDVQGDYKPSFYDVQTLLTYHFTDNLSLSYLGSFAQNNYFFVPQNRETVFGTVKAAYQLQIYFDGADLMSYRTSTHAASLVYKPNLRTQLKFIASSFSSNENEMFTVEGAYRLSDIETDMGSDDFARARSLRGVGYFINNARNKISATVNNIGHRGYLTKGKNQIQWGAFFQTESITDKLHEWYYDDSSGFSRPPLVGDSLFELNSFLSTRLGLNSYRINGYIQNTQVLNKDYNVELTYGIRANYWSFNNEAVVSPRFQFSFEPNRKYNRQILGSDKTAKPKKDWLVKAAFGWYYQPPFYRELRNFKGELNSNIKAQKAIHYVLGGDMNFKAWGRPFKFVAEAYYKQLENLIPYEIDNVRIRYMANNNSNGYAGGLDLRVNGEFVKGAESWASLSVMKTQEKITGQKDIQGNDVPAVYIPRLTDQRVTFAIFFQDYLRGNKHYRMNLNLVYGTGFPFGVPDQNRNNDLNRIPSYRRVDIGFNKVLIPEGLKKRDTFWKRNIQSAWIGLEIFNLLGVNNTISYIWIEDVEANRFAVPNYLTNRRINLRMMLKF